MSGIHRFLTRRDRGHRSARQSKEEGSHALSLPLLRGFFTSQPTQENSQDHEKKVKTVENRIRSLGITTLEVRHFSYALHSTKEDVDKAISLLLLLEDSIEGIIRSYTPNTKLLGAENRQGVTCYLDALLFAMFARLDCFEAILYKSFNDEPRRKLAVLLRFWVNMLRTGKLITTDVTKHIQDALAECGWEDAANLRQQDASEAFTFITEKLELPLLTLKMDIYHTGKEDASDDHKFINERLLEVAIPPEPADGHALTLEDCLEAYFNNRIEVKRYLERRNTVGSTRSVDSLSISKGFSAHVEEVDTTPTLSPVQSNSPQADKSNPWPSFSGINDALAARKIGRRDSIVRERFFPDSADEEAGENNLSASDPQNRKGAYRKEVMMPAWQFFSLIPWYTDNTPTNDAQVAAHFSSKRPILGMCLKRYSFLPNGKAIRLNTYIDIPTEIGLPHFIQDDNLDADAPIYGNFKLSLQAMVCHRGDSVDSGHYIAIVRGTSPNLVPPGSSGSSACMPTESPKHWMRFDDLAAERVTLIDIETALKTESPYLLFYQILPIDQDASMANLCNKAPSSRASDATLDVEDMTDISRKLRGLVVEETDSSTTEDVTSARPSFEITGPDNETPVTSSNENGRRSSIAFSDKVPVGPPRSMPSMSPRLAPTGEEGNDREPFRFSRRGSRVTTSNSGSRAASQSGETRKGTAFARFAGRLSKDRFTSDGEGEGDDSAAEVDEAAPDEMKLGPSAYDLKDRRGRGRTKDRSLRGKSKEKSKEKSWKPDRECVMM
ncbi:hypothetical protein N7462_003542 [Penicillium macrosclerotiorum]|uniref:uncharacterized protein n=1 Tax=Penicillium macrosclerotiorum TaxID=303699 RepID=UPI0025473AC2|nr:uncharacterized protein N7462_003542 [Penicillium macrosclerotiorum]KAJ5689150.1 hypothetical protein N7462_003542 [Penicillium macrosclerotiorum]